MKKKSFVIGMIAALCAVQAWAILGVGDVVFDPTNYQKAIQEVIQLAQQYEQLVRSNQILQNQYLQMLRMAVPVPVDMTQRYRALATPWTPSLTTNTYGTSGAWTSGINSGLNVSGGYASTIQPLGTYGAAMGTLPADQQDRVKRSYANVELTDGANVSGIQTIGQVRGHSAQVDAAIANLESDALSADPSMNTEIAVLNKINAAGIIGVRNTQDSNKLLVALTEQQILQAKRQRDAEAQAFNEHIRFVTDGQATMAAQAADASNAMMAWRMP